MMSSAEYQVEDSDHIDYKRKELARRSISNALKEGKIIKPKSCDLCTLEYSKLEAHHTDYGKPLFVYWLCKTCHGLTHKKNHPLNPRNTIQTPMPLTWKGNEYATVSFAIPFENYIVIKKIAKDKKITVSKLLRGVILQEFPVSDDQLNFEFEVRRTNDNPQNDKFEGAQGLDENQAALLQQKLQKLQELRGQGDSSMPRMEELLH